MPSHERIHEEPIDSNPRETLKVLRDIKQALFLSARNFAVKLEQVDGERAQLHQTIAEARRLLPERSHSPATRTNPRDPH